MTPQDMVLEFHKTFGAKIGESPSLDVSETSHELRINLIEEEFSEYKKAIEEKDLIEVADALADLAYVIYGAAITYGIDLDAVIKEVHRSNMSKLDENSKPIYRADGKIMKGPNYSPPCIEKALFKEPVGITFTNENIIKVDNYSTFFMIFEERY